MSRQLPLVITPPATADVDDLLDYYDTRESGLSERFLEAFEGVCAAITEGPRSFPVYSETYRRARVDPYGIGIAVIVTTSSP